jgi:hypothetical protein
MLANTVSRRAGQQHDLKKPSNCTAFQPIRCYVSFDVFSATFVEIFAKNCRLQGVGTLLVMDKARRMLDPKEQNDQYHADCEAGYIAFIDGGPPEVSNDSPGWRHGWNEAKEDEARKPIGSLL